MEKVKKFFKIEERGSSVRAEVIGGVVTFLALAYILFVNPFILNDAGFPTGGVFLATAISAGIATIVMGVYAKYPIALAPGMGINALVAYTVVLGYGYSWQEALAAVFISGILFLIISITPVRKMIINAVPAGLKKAIGAGIGLFIAFIGFKNAGIVVADPLGTYVTLGNLSDPTVLLSLFGIIVAIAFYSLRHKLNKFAIILAMLVTAVVGVVLGLVGVSGMPAFGSNGYNDFSTFGDTLFGFVEGFKTVFSHSNLWFVVFSLLYLDIFDTAGTLIAVAEPAGLLNEDGELQDIDKALLSDAVGTVVGAVAGTSTVTSFVESSAGIESGARTGLAAVVTGVLLLLSIVLYPVFSIFISSSALTSMALVLVGILMIGQLKTLDWSDKPTVIATFFIMISMVLFYSIGNGIAFGFVFYVIAMLFQGRAKDVSPIMYALSVAFIVYFTLGAIL